MGSTLPNAAARGGHTGAIALMATVPPTSRPTAAIPLDISFPLMISTPIYWLEELTIFLLFI